MERTKICKKCHKKFRMIKMELEFYDKYGYPLPGECPKCRHKKRQEMRGWRDFFKRPCDQCGKEIVTVYPKELGYIVYCESCFNDFYNRVDPLKLDENYKPKGIDDGLS